jgi:hypothetical protein
MLALEDVLTIEFCKKQGYFEVSSYRIKSKKSKYMIDKFLVSPLWDEHFPNSIQHRLPNPL